MRSIILSLFIVIFCLLGIPVWIFLFIVSLFNPALCDQMAQSCIQFGCNTSLWLSGINVIANGLENIPSDQPVLFVMNHRSIFDILITYPLMKTITGFIAKKELSYYPFLAQWMTVGHCLFLDRKNIRKGLKTILKGIDYLNKGISMVIFPEGTRNREKENLTSLLPFKAGSFKMAEKTGVPIIPVAIYNAGNCFENHLPWVKSTKVGITFGKPVILSELPAETRKGLSDHIYGILSEMLASYEA